MPMVSGRPEREHQGAYLPAPCQTGCPIKKGKCLVCLLVTNMENAWIELELNKNKLSLSM